MPTGPKGQNRPRRRDRQCRKGHAHATGEEEEEIIADGKDPAAKALGDKGGRT